jgi:hypothetical protein
MHPLPMLDWYAAGALLSQSDALRTAALEAVSQFLDEANGHIDPSAIFEEIDLLDAEAGPLIPLLTAQLANTDSFHRQMAVSALARLRTPGAPWVVLIEPLTRDNDLCARLQAKDALRRLKGAAAR